MKPLLEGVQRGGVTRGNGLDGVVVAIPDSSAEAEPTRLGGRGGTEVHPLDAAPDDVPTAAHDADFFFRTLRSGLVFATVSFVAQPRRAVAAA